MPSSGVQTCALRSDRKSTRLNSSHTIISYGVFCLKKIRSDHPPPRRAPGRPRGGGATTGRGRGVCVRLFGRRAPPLAAPVMVQKLFFFNDTATTEIYTLSLHDALPI